MTNETETPETVTINGIAYSHAELAEAVAKSRVQPTIVKAGEPIPEGHMRLAKLYLKMNKLGSGVFMDDITPAEALYLVCNHQVEAGANPVNGLIETGSVERQPEDERDRLAQKYGARVHDVFPGGIPQMPESYQRAINIGMKTKLRQAAMMEHDLAKT